jgi:hypothetical protein
VLIEGQAPAAWATGLRRRGHVVVEAPAWSSSFGHAHLIDVGDGEGPVLRGGSDPRAAAGAVEAW